MRRSIFIFSILISILIIGMSLPVVVMAQEVVVVQELPPEEYIPEGDPTPPPQIAVQEPQLVVVPSGNTQVYMVHDTPGIYFYDGHWYRHHHGVWFSSTSYNTPWVYARPAVVPSFVVDIPPTYPLYLPPSYHRIHYHEFHSHWRTWDRDRHWEKQDWYRNERRAEVRRDRMHRAHERMERDRHERHERVKADPVGYKKRLADPAKYNKSVHSDKTGKIDKNDKTGKIDKTGKTDKTGKIDNTDKIDKSGKTDRTGKIDKNDKTGKIDKTGKTNKTGKVDNTGKIGKAGSTTGSTTKTGGAATKTGGTTNISNQPKPQVQPKSQVRQPQPKPQPKPQVRKQPQPKPQTKPKPKPKDKDCKDGRCPK